jgi:NADH-quinone oxidoreductase subunit M
LLALRQRDIKRLVACSSISHLGFITLGVFAFNVQSIQGSTLQLFNHGIIIAALFLIVGLIYRRWGTTRLAELGGFANGTPVLAAVFLLVTLAALGLPGLNGFVGEFLILLGTFQNNPAYASLATIGVILAAAYMLRLFQGVMHGPGRMPGARVPVSGATEGEEHLTAAELAAPARGAADLSLLREWPALVPLLILIVWIGVAPNGWLHAISTASQTVVQQSQR